MVGGVEEGDLEEDGVERGEGGGGEELEGVVVGEVEGVEGCGGSCRSVHCGRKVRGLRWR